MVVFSLPLILTVLVIGQLLLVAAVLIKTGTRSHTRGPMVGALLMLGIVGYLVISSNVLSAAVEPLDPLFLALALLPPYVLWSFAISVFEIRDWSPRVRMGLYLVPSIAWIAWVGEFEWAPLANSAHRIVSIAILLFVVWAIYSERGLDLMEKRRRYRLWLVGLIALQSLAVLVVETMFAFERVPEVLETLNTVVIAIMVFALTVPLLTVSDNVLWMGTQEPVASDPPSDVSDANPDAAALLNLMAEGHYRTMGLTIGGLAEHLGMPEHQLRGLINTELGFRNFSAFLNSYRLQEAKTRLTDPSLAKRPVLSIAMDLGFASIGPFNRAFKLHTGKTPTEFRREALKTT